MEGSITPGMSNALSKRATRTMTTTSTSSETPAPPGAFRWNRGGWFGALFGGTLWLLLMAGPIASEDPLAAGAILLCYAASILYGIRLWKRRADLRPYPALRKLIGALGLCALAAVIVVDRRDAMQFLPESSQVPIWMLYGALLVFPALLVRFHFQERAARVTKHS